MKVAKFLCSGFSVAGDNEDVEPTHCLHMNVRLFLVSALDLHISVSAKPMLES